jgi:hypothetical protein
VSKPQYRIVWRNPDALIERDTLAFWREQDLLPDSADAAQRLKDLCVVAYEGPRIVGTVETPLQRLEFVRARLAMVRLAAPPERNPHHPGIRIMPARLVTIAKGVLEAWSREHPEEQVAGLGAIVRPGTFGTKMRDPVWRATGLTLVNHTTRGDQVRLVWFGHATV